MKQRMRRTTIYLPPEQHKKLHALADKTAVKAAEHVRRALDRYLKKPK